MVKPRLTLALMAALGLALAAGMGSPAWAAGPARFRLDVLTAGTFTSRGSDRPARLPA